MRLPVCRPLPRRLRHSDRTSGVIVPDVTSHADFENAIGSVDGSALAVGGADFFAAVLNRLGYGVTQQLAVPAMARTALLVCGSRIAWASRVHGCEGRGI